MWCKAIAVVCGTLSLSCMGPSFWALHQTVYVDAAFTPAQVAAIYAAADAWERATDGAVALDIREGGAIGAEDAWIYRVDEAYLPEHGPGYTGALKCRFSGAYPWIEVATRGTEGEFALIVAHEFGHALIGAAWGHAERGLMRPIIEGSCIDEEALNMLERSRGVKGHVECL